MLAYDNLVVNVSSSGYSPIPTTIGVWKNYQKIKTKFLCMDDLGLNISLMKMHTVY